MQRLVPFIFIGIMIVLFAVGIIILSYLLIFGALVGVILYIVVWIKDKLTRKNHYPEVKKPRQNRTIDHQ